MPSPLVQRLHREARLASAHALNNENIMRVLYQQFSGSASDPAESVSREPLELTNTHFDPSRPIPDTISPSAKSFSLHLLPCCFQSWTSSIFPSTLKKLNLTSSFAMSDSCT